MINPAEKVRRMLADGFEALTEISQTYCIDTPADRERLVSEYSAALDELAELERAAAVSNNLSDAIDRLVPEPPPDPHREDDEYEPPLDLSQDH